MEDKFKKNSILICIQLIFIFEIQHAKCFQCYNTSISIINNVVEMNQSAIIECDDLVQSCDLRKELVKKNTDTFLTITGNCYDSRDDEGKSFYSMSLAYQNVESNKFCYTELCNSQAMASALIKNTCEGDNNSVGSKKLFYSQSILNAASLKRVEECYYCETDEGCSLTNMGSVVKCPINNIGCIFGLRDIGSGKVWDGYCLTDIPIFSSVKTENSKLKTTFCNSNLCNSITELNNLDDLTLCEEGFYGYAYASSLKSAPILVMILVTVSLMFIKPY